MERTENVTTMQVVPNRCVGLFVLGSTVHEVLAHIKAQPSAFPSFEIYYDRNDPIAEPITINLPRNGMRARFDGKDQRLRLVEIYDFSKTKFTYKDIEIGKIPESGTVLTNSGAKSRGPTFRHVYDKLLGPTFGGQYTPPSDLNGYDVSGIYVLSYPGIAFSFPLKHSAYSPDKEFIPLLSSSAASTATSMAIFYGEDWPTVRQTLFSAPPPNLRPHTSGNKGKDDNLDDIEIARIYGAGRIELVRRSGASVDLILGETTPQDLITDLGAPDAIHWKSDRRLSIHKERTSSHASDRSLGLLHQHRSTLGDDSADSSALHSSDDDASDWEDDDNAIADTAGESASEHFYNYFSHGIDILISTSLPQSSSPHGSSDDLPSSSAHLTATKLILHGNVPGSYQFNRHRRARWSLEHIPHSEPDSEEPVLTSELPFNEISARLKGVFKGSYADPDEEALMQRGMAINRGWGDSPGSSCELLGGFEEGSSRTTRAKILNGSVGELEIEGSETGAGVGRTMLYGFPGMIFEVMENDAVCTLSVY